MSDAAELNFQPTSPTNTTTKSQTMNDIIELTVINGKPTTTSLIIAERFGKQHFHVIRDIENLACSKEFGASNFGCTSYKDASNRLKLMYTVTKDGFMFLAMGFTGKEAAAWKERFITAFNAMEAELLARIQAAQVPAPADTLFLSHSADIMVAADRTFRAGLRSGRKMGLSTAQAIRSASQLAYAKTGVDMLSELRAHDHLAHIEAGARQHPRGIVPPDLRQFWAEVQGGAIPGIACGPMLSTQVHAVYRHWCASQGLEALSLMRMVPALIASGAVRTVRKRYVQGQTVQGPCAFLVPTGPLDIPRDVYEGDWLGQCVARTNAALHALHDLQH